MSKLEIRVVCAVGALLILAACGDDDGAGNHGCPVKYAGSWTYNSFSLRHTEPRSCPVFLTAPTDMQTGGTFVDGGISRDADRVYGQVLNASNGKVGENSVNFGQNDAGEWVAPLYIAYRAATADGLLPDRALFDVFQENTVNANADMTITYTDRVQASISPGFDTDGQRTWTAQVTRGVAPFTYRWYIDWELVSTDQSITTGGGSMHLRLDVMDARGEGVSLMQLVNDTGCSDPTVLTC